MPYLAFVPEGWPQYAALIGAMLVKGFANVSAFPCITILLTNAAPSMKILGTLNGIATMTSGLSKACGPAVIGECFTMGVHKGYMILPWWLLSLASIIGAIPAWYIRDGDGPSHSEARYEILREATSPELRPESDSEHVKETRPMGYPVVTSNDAALLEVPQDLFLVESDTESECPPPPEEGSGETSSLDAPAIKLRRMSFARD